MNKKTTFNCPNCNRVYKRKIFYDRHISACELLQKSKQDRTDDIERCSDTPSLRSLYEMMISLATRNEALERKVDELTKCVSIKKKQMNVVDWLDNIYKNVPTYSKYIEENTVSPEDMELLWKYDYIEGIIHILRNWFPIENENNLPIRAFDQKDNTFFINTESGWKVMNTSQLENLIGRIGKEIMNHFVIWQDKNKHRMERDDYAVEYTTKLKKVIGGKFTKEQCNNKIRRNFYKYLKSNLKNVIQYEFSF